MKQFICWGCQPQGLWRVFVGGGRCIVDLLSAFILCCSPAKCVHHFCGNGKHKSQFWIEITRNEQSQTSQLGRCVSDYILGIHWVCYLIVGVRLAIDSKSQ
jgi:hypothetical protein